MAPDQATSALMDQLRAQGSPPISAMSPVEARRALSALAALRTPGPDVARVEEHRLEGRGGSFAVRVLVPHGRPRGVLVYLHGGGWVLGDIDAVDGTGRDLAMRTGLTVVLVDYRLAPEHRYPTAVEDSELALRWAAEHIDALVGADPPPPTDGGAPIVVAGDSAGGNLAAVLAQRSVVAGGPALAAQLLVYPVTDATLDSPSYLDPANQLLLTRDTMEWFWDHYVPDLERRSEPDASPLRGDPQGLAPAIILTAEHDPLRDEGESYAELLAQAGVDVALRRFDGQMHGFFPMSGVLPAADDALEWVVGQLERLLSRTG